MKIAQLCAASNIPKSTIHNYIRMGLLPPAHKSGLNLHLYDETHLETLMNIRRLLEKGFSLTQIKEVIVNGSATKAEQSGINTNNSGYALSAEVELEEPANQDKWQLIIDSAISLFAQNGYESVKIGDITDSLQIGKGTFYLYFKNKREVLLECFKQLKSLIHSLEINNQIREEQDIVLKMSHRWAGFHSNFKNISGILLLLRTSLNSNDPSIRQHSIESFDAIIQPIRDDIREAVAKGTIRKVDPELVTYGIVGLAELLSVRLSLDNTYDVESVKKLVEDLIRGILVPTSRA